MTDTALIMYDSTNPYDIPLTAPAVAGYIDGAYVWTAGGWQRFPAVAYPRLTITVLGNGADVLDVENGDATPDQAVGWVNVQRANGRPYPGVYCNSNLWPTVKATFTAHQVDQPWYWIADYDGLPTIPDGAVAKQYRNSPSSGGHFDLSAVSVNLKNYMNTGGKRMISQEDANVIAAAVLNWPISTTSKPAGSSGRPVWDVLGDGERIMTQLTTEGSEISTEQTALLTAIQSVQAGDVSTLVTTLAGPLAVALAPLLPAEASPAEFFTALAAQLSK